MTPEIITALLAFAFVTSVTPGPNNTMLMTSGVNFGLRRTLPHLLGVSLGLVVMVLVLGAGLAQALAAAPRAWDALRLAAFGYVLWLAWKIARAAAPGPGRAAGRPLTFWQAAGFQWVNPKVWAMALGALSAYAPGGGMGEVAAVALIFGAVNLPSTGLWALAGQGLARFLAEPRRLRRFNHAMAALLVLSMVPVLWR